MIWSFLPSPWTLPLQSAHTTPLLDWLRPLPDRLHSCQSCREEMSRFQIVITPNPAPTLLHVCQESQGYRLLVYLKFSLGGYINLSLNTLVFTPEIVSTILRSPQLQTWTLESGSRLDPRRLVDLQNSVTRVSNRSLNAGLISLTVVRLT
jgi:hypothetical protein